MRSGTPLLLTFALVSTSFGATITLKPGTTELQAMDHHSLYTWGLDFQLASNQKITGATLKLNNLYDWTSPDPGNILRMVLLDTAVPDVDQTTTTKTKTTAHYTKTTTVITAVSNGATLSSSSSKTNLALAADVFNTVTIDVPAVGIYSSGVNASGVGGKIVSYIDDPTDTLQIDDFMTDGVDKALALAAAPPAVTTENQLSKTTTPVTYNGKAAIKTVTVTEYTTTKTSETAKKETYTWDDAVALTGYSDSDGPKTKVNFSYSFSGLQVATLAGFIGNGGDFGIGFDPDCHFYDSGVSLELNVATVPDGGSTAWLLALATGALIVAHRRRRR